MLNFEGSSGDVLVRGVFLLVSWYLCWFHIWVTTFVRLFSVALSLWLLTDWTDWGLRSATSEQGSLASGDILSFSTGTSPINSCVFLPVCFRLISKKTHVVNKTISGCNEGEAPARPIWWSWMERRLGDEMKRRAGRYLFWGMNPPTPLGFGGLLKRLTLGIHWHTWRVFP